MNITQFSIEKKRILFTFMFVIFITGITTYMNMPRSEDPGFMDTRTHSPTPKSGTSSPVQYP